MGQSNLLKWPLNVEREPLITLALVTLGKFLLMERKNAKIITTELAFSHLMKMMFNFLLANTQTILFLLLPIEIQAKLLPETLFFFKWVEVFTMDINLRSPNVLLSIQKARNLNL